MGSSVKCPKCSAAIPANRLQAGGRVTCPECDASFKIRGEGQLGGGHRSQKARTTDREDGGRTARFSPLQLAIVGGGAALLLLVAGLFLLRGGGNDGKPPVGQLAAAIPFDAARFAVVDAPIPESELPDVEPQKTLITPDAAAVVESPKTPPANPAAIANDAAAAESSRALWDLSVDPPAAPVETVAEDLQIPVKTDGYEHSLYERIPVLASLNGRYALGMGSLVEEKPGAAAPRPEPSKKKPVRPSRT